MLIEVSEFDISEWYLSFFMHLLQYVKTYAALSMEFIAVFFFILLVNISFVAIMVWIILSSISVLLHLHSLLSVS